MPQYTHSQIKSALMRARTILSDPKHWTKGRMRYPIVSAPKEPDDYAYCAIGAIRQAANAYGNDPLLEVQMGLAEVAQDSLRLNGIPDKRFVDSFNDRYATHSTLLAAFDRAIAAEGKAAEQEARS